MRGSLVMAAVTATVAALAGTALAGGAPAGAAVLSGRVAPGAQL
jgi:hypothetical protein